MRLKLQEYFGLEVKEENMNNLHGLPIYLTANRKIHKFKVDKRDFIVVEIERKDKYGVSALKKQMQKYCDATGLEVIFSFAEMTQVQRNALIKANIPFIALPDQIYIPFLGIVFSNKFHEQKNIKTDKMMPVTQQVFLYLLYDKARNPIIKSIMANKLEVTRTSITRATDQLIQMRLIVQEKRGKEIYISPVERGRKLYNLAKPFLINPVQKEVMADRSKMPVHLLKAGETALAEQTMLNSPPVPVFAMYKSKEKLIGIVPIDERWENNKPLIKVQLWKYDPYFFTNNDYVDPISMICSFKGNEDERIEIQIDELMEEIEW